MRVPNSKDQILTAHTIAHEITLQALIHDEGAFDETLISFQVLDQGYRTSSLPLSLRTHDRRDPRLATFRSFHSSNKRRASVVPRPIDTNGLRPSLPVKFIRRPCPFSPANTRGRDFGGGRSWAASFPPSLSPRGENVLTVSIHRCHKNAESTVSALVIPASNDYTAIGVGKMGKKEKEFSRSRLRTAKISSARSNSVTVYWPDAYTAWALVLGPGSL